MRLLIDTHIALWAVAARSKLPPRAIDLMLDPANEISVSVVSIWESGVKHALRRRSNRDGLMSSEQALALFEASDFMILPLSAAHVVQVDRLPPHHGDPFDRLLVAQALAEPMRLITADKTLAAYGDHVLLV